MKRLILLISLSIFCINAKAASWCTFSNFDVTIRGEYVAVFNSKLSEGEGDYVYLGDLNTEQGKAILSLLLTASVTGKLARYGDNSKDWSCGRFPAYSSETVNPEFLRIVTSS